MAAGAGEGQQGGCLQAARRVLYGGITAARVMTEPRPARKPNPLLARPPKIVNVGLDGFAADLKRQNIPVLRVDWRPPAGGKPEFARLLAKLGA